MSTILTAKTLSAAVKEGFDRVRRYRKQRAMYIKDYVGHYFQTEHGVTGEMPINLVFLAIHALVPNLVQREGMNKVTTDFLGNMEYAQLLGLALDRLQKQLKMRRIMRQAIVDMCFGFAVFKTGLSASGLYLPVGEDEDVDPGQIFTDVISLDDWTFDPTAIAWDKSAFQGHRVRISRTELLEAGWNEELVQRLPAASEHPMESQWAQSLTQDSKKAGRMYDLQDYVYVVEVDVPEAEAVIYIPDPLQATFDDFLKVEEAYGPAEGPYTIGQLTQPVPDNPFPIAPVGVWRDLNEMANVIFKKFMHQSERQKDVLLYPPEQADVADAIRTAIDGDSIASQRPKEIQVASFGGQNPDNERMITELRGWFNYMAGNPDQLMGIGESADTATEYQGNQANATVRIQDMRDMIADSYADVSRKQAWYLHTDPLLFNFDQPGIPLIRRVTGEAPVQVFLTPEQRNGDFLEFNFEIVKRSLTILEPTLRSKRIMEFNTNVIPAVMQSAMVAMQMGIQINVPRQLMQIAEEMGIEDSVQEIFQDPTFEKRMQTFMMMGPKNAGKGGLSMAGIRQNGGSPMKHDIMTPGQEQNQAFQQPAAEAQSAMGFGGQQWQ